MRLTIKSRKLGRVFDFWAPASGGYVRLEDERRYGTLAPQICVDGRFMGNTVVAYTEEEFKRACRQWYRAHLRHRRYGGDHHP